ncbi:hypothetical protein BOTBODRAFT_182607 [Botryobasidium botryosum FD-172 SS1]|uniref:Transcriptional adapter 2 n=1 Tax=Botryobasidium botryosum (strain FD-172 SS1) TaxID=930990 RepID=A0A067NBN5_BOTB1|nr:hypothetical protein BOTBODRAFT_182607 [Botryobasidium botryosum FD-172 SS1]
MHVGCLYVAPDVLELQEVRSLDDDGDPSKAEPAAAAAGRGELEQVAQPTASSAALPIPAISEPGVLYECDSCVTDITHKIRIKCAAPGCEEVDLCPSCFCQGKEVGSHKAWHDYRVIEKHSYPIFTEDWGADEELLLIEGLSTNGIGNWGAAAEHIGTHTKEEVEEHYMKVYHNADTWPLPRMDLEFDIDPETFHARKRQRMQEKRMEAFNAPPFQILTSGPTNHELQGYMPGRLEFETEVENDAEDLIKDLEFGLVMEYGGADQPAPPEPEIKPDEQEEHAHSHNGKDRVRVKEESGAPSSPGDSMNIDGSSNQKPAPDPIETHESLSLKLALLDMYKEKLDKREETKAFVFDRGLLDFKKLQATEKKRTKEEREFINKHKPFGKLQTAEDFEVFIDGLLYEVALRKRIAEMQEYRRMGITSLAEAEKFEKDRFARSSKGYVREYSHLQRASSRHSVPPPHESPGKRSREGTPKPMAGPSRRPPAPLNLANAASLHLLTPAEQTLCSQLRILPKPYLVIKETLVREFTRSGGKLRRREARDYIKIDVNKTTRIWDFLVQAGVLKVPSTGDGVNGTGSYED